MFEALEYVYLVYGREVGDEGTPHLQGYVQFLRKLRLSGVRRLHAKAHWEVAKGSAKQNLEYCSKQGDVQEFGVPVVVFGGKLSKVVCNAQKRVVCADRPFDNVALI